MARTTARHGREKRGARAAAGDRALEPGRKSALPARAHAAIGEAQLGAARPAAGAGELALPLLLRLRWLLALGQTLLLLLAWWVARAELPYALMSAIAAVTFASNGLLWRWREHAQLARALPALLSADTLLLTFQLALSGGPHNPFTALYVVHVALAAVSMSVRGTAWIAALSGACYAAMFAAHLPQPLWESQHHAGSDPDAHLVGMWLALSVVAALIAYFVGRLSQQLVAARAIAARNDRLASLTALAAGAAHELGSPLGTIAVAAREIERGADAAAAEDARLIRAEVDRCREILDRMSGSATQQLHGESVPLERIVAEVREEFAGESARIQVSIAESLRRSPAARDPIHQALAVLVRNALDASAAAVRIEVAQADQHVQFRVLDRGTGIARGALARVGDPFFTTKEPGKGTGLGLYVVRMIAERLGGQLILRSAESEGTQAVLAVPCASLAARD